MMKINESKFRGKSGCLFVLFAIFIVCLWIAYNVFSVSNDSKKAQIIVTHLDIKEIAFALYQRTRTSDSLSNIDNNFVLHALFGTNTVRYASQTNSYGEVLDHWDTPYQIQVQARTNFIISSAGPNKIFGDKDDIIFNSVSNDFVKP